MSEADAVAGVLLVGATMYAVFGGADFGAGVWSLLAGRGDRGRRPRALIDWAIGPVWGRPGARTHQGVRERLVYGRAHLR